jgi:hypothetical protein
MANSSDCPPIRKRK